MSSQAGDLYEAGQLLELVEVEAAPMAFIQATPMEVMGCGRWARLGAAAGVQLVALACVEAAVVRTRAATACYLPYECR